MAGEMQSLWPRVEPLLSQVTKPARYIGGELGAQTPAYDAGSVAWLLDLSRHLRDRAPQSGPPDPVRDPERAFRRRGRADLRPVGGHGGGHAIGGGAPVLPREPSGRRVLRRAGFQPFGRAGVHQRAQPHRPGRRAPPRGRTHGGRPAGGGRGPLRLQPRAAGRLRRLLRAGRRGGGRRGDQRGAGRPPWPRWGPGAASTAGRPPGPAPGPGPAGRRLRPLLLRGQL